MKDNSKIFIERNTARYLSADQNVDMNEKIPKIRKKKTILLWISCEKGIFLKCSTWNIFVRRDFNIDNNSKSLYNKYNHEKKTMKRKISERYMDTLVNSLNCPLIGIKYRIFLMESGKVKRNA